MKKHRNPIVLFLMTFIVAMISGCGSNNPSSESIEEQGEKIYTFKSSIQSPNTNNNPLVEGFDAYLDDIERLSEGRIKFERYYGGSLVSAAEHLNAVKSGIADIALLLPDYTPAENPLATIQSLPALWEDQWTGTMALRELYEQYPEFNTEYENQGVKVVGHWALPSYYIISNKDITSVDDIKGERLIATGSLSRTADALGAVATGIVITESFEAMEKGAVDGGLLGISGSAVYSLHEVAKSILKLPVGSQGGVYGMNLNSFNQLPDDLKKIFDEAAIKNAVDFHNSYQGKSEAAATQKYIDKGVKINEVTQEEKDKFRETMQESVWNDWVNDLSKKSFPAEDILKTLVENIEKYDNELKNNGLPN